MGDAAWKLCAEVGDLKGAEEVGPGTGNEMAQTLLLFSSPFSLFKATRLRKDNEARKTRSKSFSCLLRSE